MSQTVLLSRKKRLIALLKSPDTAVRQAAARALEDVEARLNVMALIELAAKGEPLRKARALAALPRLRDSRVLPALTAALQDGEADIQAMAARAIGEHGRREGVEPLLQRIKNTDSEPVMCESIRALGALGDRNVATPLRGLLKHPNPNVVAAVLEALGELGVPAVENDLLPFLDHTNIDVRLAAIGALGKLDLPEV